MKIRLRQEAGVDLHEASVEASLVGRQRIPHRHVRVALRQSRVSGQQPYLLLALKNLLAVRVPAGVKLALVLVNPLLLDVVWRVRGAGSVIEEEWLLRRVNVGVKDHLDGLVGQVDVEVIAFFGPLRLRDRAVILGQVGVPLVGLAAQEAVEALKAAPHRPAVEGAGGSVVLRRRQVPLADAEGVVPVLQQHLRQHAVLERHAGVVPRVSGCGLHD